MAKRTRQITLPDGKLANAVIQDFHNIGGEHWNEYDLEDGTRLKIKVVVNRVVRILDEDGNPATTENGDPFVCVSSNTYIDAEGKE